MLLKVWDDDFPAIMWGEHAQGETIIVNFELLFLVCQSSPATQSYSNLFQIAKGNGNKDDRTPYYVDNYGPSDSMNNRLQHNLVNIFGFNDMGCQNFEDERQVNAVYHNNHEFFEMTDRICEENGLAPIGRWQEFHHSDFFKGGEFFLQEFFLTIWNFQTIRISRIATVQNGRIRNSSRFVRR